MLRSVALDPQGAPMAAAGRDPLAVEEARLARAAAAGDGGAFAVLYERYAQRAFNLAYRVAGSEADAADAVEEAFLSAMRGMPRLAARELAFGPCLFAATHDACHDQTRGRRRARAGETTLEFQREEIREASMRLPARQREALALRELEELSYAEIAAIMEVSPHTVAQLISRARINLRDELGGTSLASVAAPSPECERALPLIAMRDDGQLEAASRDAAWLGAHLAGCERCRLGVEAMQGAAVSYRAWAPTAAVPWLLEETMAKAAALAGADWSEAIAEADATRAPGGSLSGLPSVHLADPASDRPPRRRATLAAGLAVLLLLAGLAVALVGDNPPATSAGRTAGTAGPSAGKPGRGAKPGPAGRTKGGAAKKKARTRATPAETTPVPVPASAPGLVPTGIGVPSEPAASGPSHHHGKTGIQQTRQPSVPKSKPSPTPAPLAPPVSSPAPAAEQPPSAEESTKGPHRKHEPPGKQPGRHPH